MTRRLLGEGMLYVGPMTESIMGLPPGSRDLLPPASRRRRRLTQRLIGEFERWGYAQTMTPLLEYYEVLSRGLSADDRRQCVRFIDPRGGGAVVALRSDFTPQIARMAAMRHAANDEPRTLRVSYADELVRLPESERDAAEQHQAGVELIGDGDPAADAELIALCHAALLESGLADFRIDVSHRQVVTTVLEQLGLPRQGRTLLEGLLARKDEGGVLAMLVAGGVDEIRARAAASLCSLYGEPGVLDRARRALAPVAGEAALTGLDAVLEHLQRLDPGAASRVDVDLGEVRGFEYYTGLRLRVWAPGVPRPLVRGGRYDDLLGRYGTAAPASGFAIDLDALEAALREAESGMTEDPTPVHLVVVASHSSADARAAAARLARVARESGARSWVDPGLTWEHAVKHAGRVGAQELSFVDAQGRVRRARRVDGEPNLRPTEGPS